MNGFSGLRNFPGDDRGIAMTETALLCFFLYVPVLMMVIIWGDMTVDRTRAHIAGSYIAFRGAAPDETELRDIFFPGAAGQEDGMGAVRLAAVEYAAIDDGPRFQLPPTRYGNYAGEPPEHDLQFRLYSMALGRTWITTHVDASGGEAGFIYHVHHLRNDMARYLSGEEIVNVGQLPSELPPVRPGESLELDTGTDSRAYTAYVEALTRMYNDALTGGRLPRGEAAAVLRTRFRSPFFRELERRYDRRTLRGRVAGEGLPQYFDMQFGPPDAPGRAAPWRYEDDFHTGYAYLRNPDAHPDGDSLLDDLSVISTGGILPETRAMFRSTVDGRDVNPGSMWRERALSEEIGPDHSRYLQPGDPRP